MELRERVVVCIYSKNKRTNFLQLAISRIIKSVDEIHVVLDGYKRSPKFLNHKKIFIHQTVVANDHNFPRQFQAIKLCGSCVYIALDDSILIPYDFASRCLDCLRKYENKVIISCSGSIVSEVTNWYSVRNDTISLDESVAYDRFINLPSCNAVLFHTDILSTLASDFSVQAGVTVEMDLQLAILARRRKIPIVVLKKPHNWICSVNNEHSNEKKNINNYSVNDYLISTEGPWGWATYKDIIVPLLESLFGIITSGTINRYDLDKEFLSAIIYGKVPNKWSTNTNIFNKTLSSKVAFLEFEKKSILSELKSLRTVRRKKENSSPPITYFPKPQYPKNQVKIIAGLASFPLREESLKRSVTSIIDQIDELHIYLNNYADIPSFLINEKIIVYRSQDFKDLSANGKVYCIDNIDECYFFTLDDDIVYPADYVEKMISCIEKYSRRCAVTVHGSILPAKPVMYFQRATVYAFQDYLERDRFVSLIGSGTFAFHTSTLNAKFSDFYPHVAVDLTFSLLAREQNVPLVAIARSQNWLRYQKELVEGGLFEYFVENLTIHTAIIRGISDFSIERYKKIVQNTIVEVFQTHSNETLDKLGFDVEFLNYVNGGAIPSDWTNSTQTYRNTTQRVLKSLDNYYKIDFAKISSEYLKEKQKRLARPLSSDVKPVTNHPLFLERTLWYKPDIPDFKVHDRPKNTSQKIGFIGGQRLATCLGYEAEIFIITEHNYQRVLKFCQIDFLLVESVYESITCSFSGACNENVETRNILEDLLSVCQKENIPSVFWQTKSSAYDSYFKTIIDRFDFVFCADQKSIEFYSQSKSNVYLLENAVQPAIHNKFISHFSREKYSIPILYNFWSDIFFSKYNEELLDRLTPYGLTISDTSIRQWKQRLYDSKQFTPYVRGFLRYADFWNILKYTKFFLTSNISNFSNTYIEQLLLDSAASGCLNLHFSDHESDPIDSTCSGMIKFKDYSSLVDCVKESIDNELYRVHYAQQSWRNAHSKNTYAHRLKIISNTCGLENDWDEFPMCSMICPTNKINFMENIINNCQKQSYPNKELIVIINSEEVDINSLRKKHENIDWLHIVHVSSEQPIGAALNVGTRKAKGELCFKTDDDDIYSSHYLEDSIYHLRSYPADVWGKPPVPWILFESDNELFYRKTEACEYPCVIPDPQLFNDTQVTFGGNSLGFRKKVLEDCPFPEDCVGSADTEIQGKWAFAGKKGVFLDQTGVIIGRRADKTQHNWKVDDKRLKKRSHKCTVNNAISFALCEE